MLQSKELTTKISSQTEFTMSRRLSAHNKVVFKLSYPRGISNRYTQKIPVVEISQGIEREVLSTNCFRTSGFRKLELITRSDGIC